MRQLLGYVIVGACLVLGGVWVSAQVSLTTFQPGQVIRAAEVNANFEALRDASYTKAEVDALIAAAVNAGKPAYAFVSPAGNAIVASRVDAVSRSDTGRYCVVVGRDDFDTRGAQATLTFPGLTTDHISLGTGHGSHCNSLWTDDAQAVPVYITNAAGAYVDGYFSILVPTR